VLVLVLLVLLVLVVVVARWLGGASVSGRPSHLRPTRP
jgi:hypothetical protein